MRGRKVGLTAVVLVAATVGATSALGASLAVIPKITNAQTGVVQTGVYPNGITPDGRFVGGTAGLGYTSYGQNTGFVYDAATGTAGHIVAGSYQANVDGIGYWSDGTTTKVVIEGNNGGWQSMNTWDTATNWNGTAGWAKVRRTNTHAYVGSGQNRVAGSSVGGLIHGVFQTSSTQEYIDTFNGTGLVATPDTKSTTDSTTMNGISNAGKAVGVRANQCYSFTYTGGGGVSGAAYVNAAPDGTAAGTLYDIADDGSIMGGFGHVTGKTGWFPFVYDGTASYELPLLVGGTGLATNGSVYSIAPNGDYAVGMDYSKGYELAVLWDLRDLNNIQVVDLTQLAIDQGILGPFTGNLRRGTGVGINAQGLPVIAGVGYAGSLEANGWTGFVMTVPEPATLSLLALGVLPLLRRRRR